jgi:hypothetical protein
MRLEEPDAGTGNTYAAKPDVEDAHESIWCEKLRTERLDDEILITRIASCVVIGSWIDH